MFSTFYFEIRIIYDIAWDSVHRQCQWTYMLCHLKLSIAIQLRPVRHAAVIRENSGLVAWCFDSLKLSYLENRVTLCFIFSEFWVPADFVENFNYCWVWPVWTFFNSFWRWKMLFRIMLWVAQVLPCRACEKHSMVWRSRKWLLKHLRIWNTKHWVWHQTNSNACSIKGSRKYDVVSMSGHEYWVLSEQALQLKILAVAYNLLVGTHD